MNVREACRLLSVLFFASCTGQVGVTATNSAHRGGGDPGGAPSPSGGSGGSGAGGAAGGVGGPSGGAAGNPTELDCTTPQAPAVRARLLSPTQYAHSAQDLLRVTGHYTQDFGAAVFAQLTDLDVEHRASAAAAIAHDAVATLAQWSPCMPPATAAAACEPQIVDRVGTSAFRRPLDATDRAQLTALFDAGVKQKDFTTGVEWLLTGVLQSPDFLYQLVKPDPAEKAGEVRALSAHEYAARLSYFIWDSAPDDMLVKAANAGELSDGAKLRAEATRMVVDARFLRGVEGFYSGWLRIGAFQEVARDATGANGTVFDDSVVKGLATSLLMSATQLYGDPKPNVASLFSGDTYYMNDALRKYYGVIGSGTAFTPVAMTGEPRHGVITHPALLALLARPKESFPIARGLFVRRTLLCQDIQLPNGLVIPELPPIADGVTTRDRIDAHVREPLCKTCHEQIDPPGFALENFDEVGRHRTVDHGKAVDTSGTMSGADDLDGPFATGEDLLSKLGASPAVRACFAQKYLEYALARTAEPEDACSIAALAKSFAASGDLKELVVSVAASDTFRYRQAEGIAP